MVATGCASGTLIFLFPGATYLPAGAVATLTFVLIQMTFPGCRPNLNRPFCPWNWALFVFGLKLVILPLSIVITGVEVGELPHLPTDFAMNVGMLISTLAFFAFAAGFWFCRRSARVQQSVGTVEPTRGWVPPRRLLAAFAILGTTGMFLAFGGVRGLLAYLTNPSGQLMLLELSRESPSTLASVASVVFRPFLGFAFIILFCRVSDARTDVGKPLGFTPPILAALAAMSFATFNYNRGSFVVPIVALVGVTLNKTRRSWRQVVPLLCLLLVLLSVSTTYRFLRGHVDLLSEPTQGFSSAVHGFAFQETIQEYGCGPQRLGFLLEATHWGGQLHFGQTIISALLSPVPILGKPFREANGVTLFNKTLNRGDAADQLLPAEGELFLDFHLLGVALGFGCLGWIVGNLQSAFERSNSSFEMFMPLYASIWILFSVIGPLEVLSQILIYFFWPIYVYYACRRLTGASPQKTLKAANLPN